ncbi:hypothetical protein H8D57_03025 [bacterium]|nr:hypothetical protein [bacterium]
MKSHKHIHNRIKTPKWINPLLFFLLAPFWLAGCLNPFAPAEGDIGSSVWSDQKTIGGLLRNFALAYNYKDSLRYADCLSDGFMFKFYDQNNEREDRWFREIDLKTTGAMFRSFDPINLEWNLIPEWVEDFGGADTTVDFVVKFNLSLGEDLLLMGYAGFSVRKEEQTKFKLLLWQDDF